MRTLPKIKPSTKHSLSNLHRAFLESVLLHDPLGVLPENVESIAVCDQRGPNAKFKLKGRAEG